MHTNRKYSLLSRAILYVQALLMCFSSGILTLHDNLIYSRLSLLLHCFLCFFFQIFRIESLQFLDAGFWSKKAGFLCWSIGWFSFIGTLNIHFQRYRRFFWSFFSTHFFYEGRKSSFYWWNLILALRGIKSWSRRQTLRKMAYTKLLFFMRIQWFLWNLLSHFKWFQSLVTQIKRSLFAQLLSMKMNP